MKVCTQKILILCHILLHLLTYFFHKESFKTSFYVNVLCILKELPYLHYMRSLSQEALGMVRVLRKIAFGSFLAQ